MRLTMPAAYIAHFLHDQHCANEEVRRRILTIHHSHTSSVPPALSSSVTLHMPMDHSRALRACVAHAKGLKPPIGPTTSHQTFGPLNPI